MFVLIIVATMAMTGKVESHQEYYASMEGCVAQSKLILPELEAKAKEKTRVYDFFVTCVEVK